MALIRPKTSLPIGGITYRPFASRGFAEIAFCAVTASEQVRGFGTRLMNHTKQAGLVRDACAAFLTYADNSAVGYFSKQGFGKMITIPRDHWFGYIKDYDGGTLMECTIDPLLDHTAIPELVRSQKAAIWARITSQTNVHHVYAPVATFVEARSEYEADHVRRRKEAEAEAKLVTPLPFTAPPLDDVEIPGLASSSYDPSTYIPHYVLKGDVVGAKRDTSPETLQAVTRHIWNEMSMHPEAWPFLEPVDANLVTDYYTVIRDMMDLATIEERLEKGTYYRSLEMFVADFRKVFRNCKFYNAPGTVYHTAADNLDRHLLKLCRQFIIRIK